MKIFFHQKKSPKVAQNDFFSVLSNFRNFFFSLWSPFDNFFPFTQQQSSSTNRLPTVRRNQTKTYLEDANNTIVRIEPVETVTRRPNLTEAAASNTPTTIVVPVVPIVISVCGIFLVAGVVALIIFRKHVCATVAKRIHKPNKDAKAKKSNQRNLSSVTDDGRNSMDMRQWHGPVAYNNGYTPWNAQQLNHHDPVQGQISNSSFTYSNQAYDANQQVPPPFDRWEFPRHRLKVFNILGEGAFGQVWRCEATDIDGIEGVSTVAVKTLKENAKENEKTDLLSELQVMKSLEPHVNVVRLLGCCIEKDPVFVIIEYVNQGKLQTYLRNSRVEK